MKFKVDIVFAFVTFCLLIVCEFINTQPDQDIATVSTILAPSEIEMPVEYENGVHADIITLTYAAPIEIETPAESEEIYIPETTLVATETETDSVSTVADIPETTSVAVTPDVTEAVSVPVPTPANVYISEEDIALIALVTMAEAEGECEYGKRLVIDTILNRMDSPYFPNTVYEVIYQPGQFSSMWNGRVDVCCVREDICQLVREELQSRSNMDVIFFRTQHFSEYGVPLFQVEHHYFSSYN